MAIHSSSCVSSVSEELKVATGDLKPKKIAKRLKIVDSSLIGQPSGNG